MGLFDFIADNKRKKQNAEFNRVSELAAREKAARKIKSDQIEAKRIIEIEQEKNREAYSRLCSTDDDRFFIGIQWLIENEKPIMSTVITKIGREVNGSYYSTPYGIKIGEMVNFENHFDYDEDGNDKSKIIVSYNGFDIGELGKSSKEKLEDFDIDNLIGVVARIVDDDEIKIAVAIYAGSEYCEPGYSQLRTIITGTKYDNQDGSSRQDYLSREFCGNRLKLVKSEFEGNPAVIVCTARNFQLGYLKADLATEFCNKIDQNVIGGIYISRIFTIDGIRYCDIVINISNF